MGRLFQYLIRARRPRAHLTNPTPWVPPSTDSSAEAPQISDPPKQTTSPTWLRSTVLWWTMFPSPRKSSTVRAVTYWVQRARPRPTRTSLLISGTRSARTCGGGYRRELSRNMSASILCLRTTINCKYSVIVICIW